MEKQDIITIEDEIQFAFENFASYSKEEQTKLVKIITSKFKVDQMKHQLRKPVTIGLALFSNSVNTTAPKTISARMNLAFDEGNVNNLVLALLNDSQFTDYISKNLVNGDTDILYKFASVQHYYAGMNPSNNWQINLAKCSNEIAQFMIDKFADLIKEEIANSASRFGGSDYYIEQINVRLIQVCKLAGIQNLKMGKVVLALKDKTAHLDRFAKEIPGASKYMTML